MARRFREARAKAGLPKSLVLYCGRHDFGTRVLKKTGNLKLVMQAMGHVDVKTAMKYQHPELDIVRSVLNDTEPGAPAQARSGSSYGTFHGTRRKFGQTITAK